MALTLRRPVPAHKSPVTLHGLLAFDDLFAAGGLRVVDDSTGAVFLPGCCDGLEDWRDRHVFHPPTRRESPGLRIPAHWTVVLVLRLQGDRVTG